MYSTSVDCVGQAPNTIHSKTFVNMVMNDGVLCVQDTAWSVNWLSVLCRHSALSCSRPTEMHWIVNFQATETNKNNNNKPRIKCIVMAL